MARQFLDQEVTARSYEARNERNVATAPTRSKSVSTETAHALPLFLRNRRQKMFGKNSSRCRPRCPERTHPVTCGILSCITIISHRKAADMATNVLVCHRRTKSPRKTRRATAEQKVRKRRNTWKRPSCLVHERQQFGLCISCTGVADDKISIAGKQKIHEDRPASQVSKRRCAFRKKTVEKRSIAGCDIQPSHSHERSPCALNFEDRSREETRKQKRCARRDPWIWQAKCTTIEVAWKRAKPRSSRLQKFGGCPHHLLLNLRKEKSSWTRAPPGTC